VTFEQAAEEYHNAHKTEWRSAKHVTKWKALIENHVNPVMGKVPVADVDQALLLQVRDRSGSPRRRLPGAFGARSRRSCRGPLPTHATIV